MGALQCVRKVNACFASDFIVEDRKAMYMFTYLLTYIAKYDHNIVILQSGVLYARIYYLMI